MESFLVDGDGQMAKNWMSLVQVRFGYLSLLLGLGFIAAVSDWIICQRAIPQTDAQKIEQELLAVSPRTRWTQASWKQGFHQNDAPSRLAAIDRPSSAVVKY